MLVLHSCNSCHRGGKGEGFVGILSIKPLSPPTGLWSSDSPEMPLVGGCCNMVASGVKWVGPLQESVGWSMGVLPGRWTLKHCFIYFNIFCNL